MTRFYFICFALFLLGCEKEIENTASDYEAYVVVNSIISTDSTFSVQLNYSKSIYDKGAFKPVENALVYIAVKEDTDNSATQDFFLRSQGNGLYTRSNNPIEGRFYEMVIEVDGQTITAETYVPRVLQAEVSRPSSQLNPDTKQRSFSVDIVINEADEDEQNYYAWDLTPTTTPTTVNELDDLTDKGLPTDENGQVIVSESIENPSRSVVKSNGLSGAIPVLSDSGGKITASFDDPETTDGGVTDPNPDTPTNTTAETSRPKQKYKLKVWAISHDYYNYLISLQYNSNGNNSETTFRGPYSNINNGSGIFAGYNLKEFEVEF